MQLVAYGAQDIYLTGNPMITYFKVVYRRHTNFAMESIAQVFSGTVNFNNKVTALIARSGDLVSGLTMEATLPALTNGRWTDDVGHHLIDEVSIEIGGQLIDKHYGDWLEIWAQLTVPASKQIGYREMIGQDPKDSLGRPSGLQRLYTTTNFDTITHAARKVYIPLQFWFCRNVGLALPLIALQYHEVKVSVTFKAESSLIHVAGPTDGVANAATATGTSLQATLYADYIYLDTDERRRFAQVSHEYLIEQLQFAGDQTFTGAGTTSQNIKLVFNHPVKELIWVCRYGEMTTSHQYSNYTNLQAEAVAFGWTQGNNFSFETDTRGQDYTRPARISTTDQSNTTVVASNPVATAQLKLNGHDRFAVRDGTYFNWEQTYKHHTCVPKSPGINVYSFALKPEDHQPSGTCNFSRIDNAQLSLTLTAGRDTTGAITTGDITTGVIKIFAMSYNVLRIMSGMGGLAYSN
jgi:hypothetical protein